MTVWGTMEITFPSGIGGGFTATINIDALPTTTQRPNIYLPNVHSEYPSGKLWKVRLPGLYIDPDQYEAAGPGDEVILYWAPAFDNENHQEWPKRLR